MLNYQGVHVLKHESMTILGKPMDFLQEIHALSTRHWAILGQRHLEPGKVIHHASSWFTMVHERIKKKMFESKIVLDDRYR